MTTIGENQAADAGSALGQDDIYSDSPVPTHDRAQLRRVLIPAGSAVLGIVVVFGIWWAIAAAFHISDAVLPAPPDVLSATSANFSQLLDNAWPTAIEAAVGYAFAIVLGIPLGWFLSRPGRVQKVMNAGVVSAQVFPKIALAPLFVIWFGFGYAPKILYVILLCFFPIVLNSTAGFAGISQEIRDLASVLHLGLLSRLWKVEIPAALPNIFAGLKISATLTIIAAIVMEFIGSNKGLGYFILQTESTLQVPLMFGAFIVITIVGFLLYGLVSLAEAIAIPWHISRRRVRGS